MGIFSQAIDLVKPALKQYFKSKASKNRGNSHNNGYTRNVGIPSALFDMKEPSSDDKTRRMALVISELLQRENLAGPENLFSLLAQGGSFKGKLIRAYVLSHAMKTEISARKMFMQSMMDTYIDEEIDAYMSKVVTTVGDNPEEIKQKASMLGADVLLDLDDSDFENLANNLL